MTSAFFFFVEQLVKVDDEAAAVVPHEADQVLLEHWDVCPHVNWVCLVAHVPIDILARRDEQFFQGLDVLATQRATLRVADIAVADGEHTGQGVRGLYLGQG